jgi:cobalt/nickel transport system permease protein
VTEGSAQAGGASWDQFSHAADSVVHRLDARVRILLTLSLALLVVWADKPAVLMVVLVSAVLLAGLARLPLRQTLIRLALLDLFMALVVLTLPFTVSGEPVFSIGGLTASSEGLWRAAAIALKANTVLLVSLALLGTLETVALGHGLHHLRVPGKLVQLLLFTVRYLDLLQREYHRLRWAMRARGFQARVDRHTWRSFGYLFGMLLVRALERSQRVLTAMRCRGFEGRFHRFRHPPAQPLDLWVGALAVLLLGSLTLWELV